MAKLKVHAGDFESNPGNSCSGGFLYIYPRGGWVRECLGPRDIETIEKASEESVKRLGGTAGWGLAGGALFGPVGLLAGLVAGGRGQDVTFVAQFKDGRRLIASVRSSEYAKLAAAYLASRDVPRRPIPEVVDGPWTRLDLKAVSMLDAEKLAVFRRRRDAMHEGGYDWDVAEPMLADYIERNAN